MIPITRATLPDELSLQLVALSKELGTLPADARKQAAQDLWKKSSTRARVYQPLKQILQQMALGLEQCMYCGTDFGTDVDHFEPVARNPLRTFDWLNHLLACTSCNSNHKRHQFPTDADGRALLVDPTLEDPFEHMTLSLSTDLYVPVSAKGAATIEVCGLNRRQLVDGRRRARNTVAICLRLLVSASLDGKDTEAREIAATIQQQPFADVCQAMLRQALAPGAEHIFSGAAVAGLTSDVLVYLRMPEIRSALLH
ncbi:MAG TPA: HNH endonuclease [Trebonia sp.]|jgi:hypothetical protein|nr:HNH endonuclease [Trebonia sp.]